MNLITRTIPALILGLSGLTLSAASQADSSFSFSISTGYPSARTSYSYRESYYRPYGRACNPYRRPRAYNIDTYVEKRVYTDYGHHRHYRDGDDRDEYDGHHNRHRKYRHHDGHHYRKHGDRDDRRYPAGYARLGYY